MSWRVTKPPPFVQSPDQGTVTGQMEQAGICRSSTCYRDEIPVFSIGEIDMRFLLPMIVKPRLLAPCLLIPAQSLSTCVRAVLFPTIVRSTHVYITIRF